MQLSPELLHWIGVAGFAAIAIGTFGYTWRKRRTGPGSLQAWLTAHVATGLAGSGAIVLHTSFAFRGLAGVTFWALAVVVVSGVAGRFIYTRFPKTRPRGAIAMWWVLHVPLALAMFALAVVHIGATLYYATLTP